MSLSPTRYDSPFAYNSLNGQQTETDAAQQQQSANTSEEAIAGANDSTQSAGEVETNGSANTDSTNGANGTDSDTKETSGESVKLPVLPSRDEALKDLPSKDSLAESQRFIGNFQAYKLQQAIPKPVLPAPVTPKPVSSPTTQSAQQKQPPATTGPTVESQKPVNPKELKNYVSPAEAKIFVDRFNGDVNALGKELSFKLMSQNPAERDFVRAALAYVSSSSSPQTASIVAKQLIKSIPGDGLLRAIAQSPEGSRSLNLTKSFLNLDSASNGGEIARLNKVLSPTSADGKTASVSNTSEPQITATNRRGESITLERVAGNYKPLTPEQFLSGDSNSLASISIGSAEGNRTVTGGYNPKTYNGHYDPNNGNLNIGSFSKQTSKPGTTPAEADREQLKLLESKLPAYYLDFGQK